MRLLRFVKTAGVVCALTSALFGCGGSQTNVAVIPAAAISPNHKPATAYFVITVPQNTSTGTRPHFVSPATQSIAMIVTTLSGKVVLTKDADLTPKSPGCAKSSSGTRCTISGISLSTGTFAADVTAYSRTKEKGSILSHVQRVPFTLKGGASNKIGFTMDGVPASLSVVPSSSAVSGSLTKGFTIGAGDVWGSAQTFLIGPLDAAGNTIVGPGSPHLAISTSNSSFALFPPVGSQQSFAITPPLRVQSAATRLTLTASYSDRTVCAQTGAHCVATFNVAYAPFATDDWVTFAHDFQRTGSQKQPTGISASTVSSLVQRWRVSIPGGVYSSPVVYNGNVIVVSYPGVVYDLSAVDGSIIWKTQISFVAQEDTRSSPMIDVADGLVFMGTWYAPNSNVTIPQPSHFFALHLNDGTVAWKILLPGLVHDAPVYANGTVYEGWSGGDGCINGGVDAFDPKTGTVKWTWLTNPIKNPGGGGGVWGAIAWDGAHIIFGTGNTCGADVWGQGAIALNPDGSLAWYYQADPTYYDDNDTGGGVSVVNNTASFENKNGSLYTLDAATGHKLFSTPLGGTWGHDTPTTDGSTFVIGCGFLPVSSSAKRIDQSLADRPGNVKRGNMSCLKAVSAEGTMLWSIPMTGAIDAYAAIDNGIVFEGMDSEMDAISLQSGTVLAQWPGASYFNAGPVVVPSGLYFADRYGYMYAFSLPR